MARQLKPDRAENKKSFIFEVSQVLWQLLNLLLLQSYAGKQKFHASVDKFYQFLYLYINKSRKLMESNGLIGIASSYPLGLYIVLPIITIYSGLYLNISNHYVLRPKIEAFLQKASISSSLASQLIIDVLSNLSFITYAVSSFYLTAFSDHPLRTLQYYNSYWFTVCLAMVMYIKHNGEDVVSNVVMAKNAIVLGLCYVNMIYHYFSSNLFISMPAVFVGLYVINLFINSNQDKFIQVVYEVLGIKVKPVLKNRPKLMTKLPTMEYLAKNYPITREQLDDKLQAFDKQKQKQTKQLFKPNKTRKAQTTQIDTKVLARQKLMQICLSIHLSSVKKEEEQAHTLRQYFGFMNGTLSEKTSEGKSNGGGARHRKTYFNNRSKTSGVNKLMRKTIKKTDSMKQKQDDNVEKIRQKTQKLDLKLQQTGSQLINLQKFDIEQQNIGIDSLQSESFLLYIFPVRLFESSRIISTVFSIMINLGFGILLNYCQNVMNTLKYGRFFEFVFAALLLPIIPKASPSEYANTMTLATIWKYGICGLLACISIANSATGDNPSFNLTWKSTNHLKILSIIQIVTLVISFSFLLSGRNRYKILIIVFLLALGANAGVTYFSITQ